MENPENPENKESIEYLGKCLLIKANGKRILAVGDLHLGYEETLNLAGIYISREMFNEIISEFNEIFSKTGKLDEIILLGDVKHDFGKNLNQEWNDALKLFEYFESKAKKIIITRGNHDNYLKNITSKKQIEVLDYYISKEYCFLHGNKEYPEMLSKDIKFWIMGHAHPAVKITDNFKTEKYKCFLTGNYKGKTIIILPSFIEFHEGTDPRESQNKLAWNFNFSNFNVKVITDNLKVLDFGMLGKLK